MKNLKQPVIGAFGLATAAVILFGVMSAFAAPTSPPPGGGASLPLTQSASTETKSGALVLGGLTVNGATSLQGVTISSLTLGGVAKTAWPTSSVQVQDVSVYGTANTNYPNCGGGSYYGGQCNCSATFSVSMPISTGVPLSFNNYSVTCNYGQGTMSGIQTGFSGQNATVSGNCNFSQYSSYYCYNINNPIISVSGSVRTIQ